MYTLNLTRDRMGALALGLSALLFFLSPLYVPIDPSEPSGLGALWQTGWLFILGMTLFPFGMLAIYACVAKQRGGRLALVALIFQLLAVGPLQVFAGLDTFGLSTLRHHYFQQAENSETFQVLQTIMAELMMKASPPLPFPWSLMGGYSLLILGLVLLDVGIIVLVIAIWRSGVLSKWASVLYALGCVLFIVVVFASPGDKIRVADAVIGATGGVWLAWSLWQQKPDGVA